MTADTIVLEAHHCENGTTYRVTFQGPDAEAAAIDYIQRRVDTHAIQELEDKPLRDYPSLRRTLYPLCDHGMSLDLCEGPFHYPSADQERARGWN